MLRNRLSLLSDLDVCLTELLLCNFARSAAEEILCITVHRECDNFSDVLLTSEDHDHTVNARSHSCVRRSTELECAVESAELCLELFFGITCDLECLLHDVEVMVSYSAG